jgi:hypothetical protein
MSDQMQTGRSCGAGRTGRTGETSVAFLTRWALWSGGSLLTRRTLRPRATQEREYRNNGDDRE